MIFWFLFLNLRFCDLWTVKLYFVFKHKLQPKHVGNDMWDVAMERRDKKIVEQYSSAGN